MIRTCSALMFSVLVLSVGGTAALAHSRCDGDFELSNGEWVATRHCQREAANEVARENHERISQHPTRPNEMTPDEFCRWNGHDIRTQPYCDSYRD